MRDAFGVEHDDEVAKAMGLRPVADFVKGAASALGRKAPGMGPMTQAGSKGAGMGAGVRQAAGAVKTGATSGFSTARAAMPKIPKPTGTQMKVGGAIAGTGLVAGGVGHSMGKPDWQR